MDNPTLAELADKVPALVKAGIKGLSDDDRLGLAMALVEGGRMTFSEMKAKYGLNPSTLSSHLNALQRGDLIRNYYEKNEGRAYSYYEATDLPKVMLSALFIAVRKMGVVERPIRAHGYDPLANQGGASEVPSWPHVTGRPEAQSQAATPTITHASKAHIFINVVEEAQHNDGIYRFGSKATVADRPAKKGAQNE